MTEHDQEELAPTNDVQAAIRGEVNRVLRIIVIAAAIAVLAFLTVRIQHNRSVKSCEAVNEIVGSSFADDCGSRW